MIENRTIDGRKATVAYLDEHMRPVDSRDAQLVKITFEDNGETRWLTPTAAAGGKMKKFLRNCVEDLEYASKDPENPKLMEICIYGLLITYLLFYVLGSFFCSSLDGPCLG
jgi:hypothetical protein